jgi:hypothetical protein
LRNSLLRNGELASLAYGSFKELLKFKELLHIEVMVLRTWEHGFLSILGDPLRVFQCFVQSGALFLRYIGRWFSCILDRALTCLFGPHFQLFVLGSVSRVRGSVAGHLWNAVFPLDRRRRRAENRHEPVDDREAVADGSRQRFERLAATSRADTRTSLFSFSWIRFFPGEGENCVRHRVRARFQRQSARPIARKRRYTRHLPFLPKSYVLLPLPENCFLGIHETGKFKEPHKSGNCSKVSKWLVEYRGILGGSVVHLGQNHGRFGVEPWSIWGRF